MRSSCTSSRRPPFAVRLALCVGLGAALTASNGAAVGVAVAAGLYLALSLGGRRR